MRRKKRDKSSRAFSRGYISGIRGHSTDICPYASQLDERGAWFGGYRKGRADYNAGYLEAN